jgi:hypothetical protein
MRPQFATLAVVIALGGPWGAVALRAVPAALDSAALRVEALDDGRLAVTERDSGRVWRQALVGGSRLEVAAAPRWSRDAGGREALTLDLQLPGFGVPPDYRATPTLCRLEVTLGETPRDVTVVLTAPPTAALHAVHYPLSFVCQEPDAQLLFPHAEGVLLPLRRDAPGFVALPYVDIYGGIGCYTACFGLLNLARGDGVLCAFDSPELAAFEMVDTVLDGTSLQLPRLVWRASKQRFDRPRSVTFTFSTAGGYVALAKDYQRHFRRWGFAKTLQEKSLGNPEVAKLAGAPVLWVVGPGDDVLHVAEALRADGVERAVINIGSPWWNKPQDFAAGLARMATVIEAIRGLGFIVSRYDQYRDTNPALEGRSLYHQINWEVFPAAAVIDATGKPLPGWEAPGVIMNPVVGLQLAARRLPAELQTHRFNGRFVDCVGTCVFWEGEDWSAAHPLDTYQARTAREDLLKLVAEQGLVVGTEGGIDCLLPNLHWLETPMSLVRWTAASLPAPGWTPAELKPEYAINLDPRRRIPFYSLVHHADVVSTWRWEDAFNRLPEHWQTKSLFSLLYGAPPLFFVDRAAFDRDRARIVQTIKEVCGWGRQVAFAEMLAHRAITADAQVQETGFADGRAVVVNFGPEPFTLSDGRTVAARGYLIAAPRPGNGPAPAPLAAER